MSDHARAAIATGDLAVIIRAYRSFTGATQRQLAELLGYDPTYISMIETRRREISDVATRQRIARHLGLPPYALGVSDRSGADITAMLQFGESTIRLAVLARQAGYGAEAVNELWPLVTRLEMRVAEERGERDVLMLLARARAELGVSLGYVLPDERLVSAARWTGKALWLAERLGDQELFAFVLRVHGNELRKIGRTGAAVARLLRATQLVSDNDRSAVLVQMARAIGGLGDAAMFDQVIKSAWRFVDKGGILASPYAVNEAHLRGLVHTGRTKRAMNLLDRRRVPMTTAPPQWQAISQVTTGEVLLACADLAGAERVLQAAVGIAERHRLPRQIQRVVTACEGRLPEIRGTAIAALGRLGVVAGR